MIQFHAVMIDETGCEFGADVEAFDKGRAYDLLKEMYPESRVEQLESPGEAEERVRLMQQRINWEYEHPGMEGQWYPGIEDDDDFAY